jgi:hypothetical protein
MENDSKINPDGEKSASTSGKLNSGKKQLHFFVLSTLSNESTKHFNKVHKRKFYSFGCGHEPGANSNARF